MIRAPTDLLKQTQEQVEELVEILHDNVDKALERDTKLSELNEISENLEKSANAFKTQAVVVKRNQRWKHMKTKLVFAGIAAVIIIIIICEFQILNDVCFFYSILFYFSFFLS